MSKENKNVLASYKPRPTPAAKSPNTRLDGQGREIVSSEPHELLITSLHPIPMQEQVRNLTRLSRIRRQAAFDVSALHPDYMGEDIEDDFGVEGLTPHELAGMQSGFDHLHHEVPGDVSGREEPSPTPAPSPASPPKEGE